MVVDEYELNINNGEIKNVGDSDNDVVYAVTENDDGTTTRTGASVEFSGKPIESVVNKGDSEEGKPIQNVSVENTSDGEKLFSFVIEQTGENQEWGLVDYSLNNQEAKSVVTTSGNERKDSESSRIVAVLTGNPNAKIHKADHSHPVRPTSEHSSEGDRAVRDKVISNNSEAEVNIHFNQGNRWYKRSIKNDTKYFYKGEF
ncbi:MULTISPECIES: JAB-like toxin 1 domain-containing protein [unclassified Lentimicrobium]|uniref:JAB-like toxin 1 domain-containing protein n=1 Tax=unclassified Lentimicrobium TaxID=2677434 RepID=UPI00210FAE76|nr:MULTISPECIES: JAB-like toxin 1 domain-containing protein [unclassified Lentimicrobium]